MRYTFIVFGLLELFAGIIALTGSADIINERFPGMNMSPEAMQFVAGFGAAVTSLAIISFVAFFIKDRLSLIALSIGFAFYNIVAALGCLTSVKYAEQLFVGGILHTVLSVLFIVMLVQHFRTPKTETDTSPATASE